jgi:hypothetical protein
VEACAPPAPLEEVADFVDDYRELWEKRLDRLEDYLSDCRKKTNRTRRRDTGIAATTIDISTHGRGEPCIDDRPTSTSSTADREIVTTRLIDALASSSEAFRTRNTWGQWFGPTASRP